MGIDINIDGNVASWNYKKLHAFGAVGNLEASLEEIPKLAKDLKIEFGKNSDIPDGTLYAVFCFDPLIEINMSKETENEASMAIYGLSAENTRSFLDTFAGKIGFVKKEPERDFLDIFQNELSDFAIKSYTDSEIFAARRRGNFDDIFWAFRYINFLNSYQDVPWNKSQKIAKQKFNVKLP